ncbi:hypothetical protein EJ06DRAFT_216478 [Trichodelitschia bisporula]|uniref:Uncharacterized protein n=1 Tax=Trichodelitschia bisporula TaxID=703511 RepID=A0A6G1I9B2_9PEZI|nr:hypothetical protein EJ06DRAFT_216478 [Trichodelitschia bisporula]
MVKALAMQPHGEGRRSNLSWCSVHGRWIALPGNQPCRCRYRNTHLFVALTAWASGLDTVMRVWGIFKPYLAAAAPSITVVLRAQPGRWFPMPTLTQRRKRREMADTGTIFDGWSLMSQLVPNGDGLCPTRQTTRDVLAGRNSRGRCKQLGRANVQPREQVVDVVR